MTRSRLPPKTAQMDVWDHVLEKAHARGKITRKSRAAFFASVDSYVFGPTLLNFWSLQSLIYTRTREDCKRNPSDTYSLCQIQRGNLTLHQGRKTCRAKEKDCFLLDLSAPFSAEAPPSGCCFKGLGLPSPILQRILPDPKKHAASVLPQDNDWGKALVATMHAITPKNFQTPTFPQKCIFINIGFLLSLTLDPTEQALKTREENPLELYRQSLRQRFYETALSPAKLAEEYNVSIRTVHSVFSRAQSSFGHELQAVRIRQAQKLLTDPRFDGKTVAEIGHLVGFAHASHFATCFHKALGLTPTAYRLQRQNKSDSC